MDVTYLSIVNEFCLIKTSSKFDPTPEFSIYAILDPDSSKYHPFDPKFDFKSFACYSGNGHFILRKNIEVWYKS